MSVVGPLSSFHTVFTDVVKAADEGLLKVIADTNDTRVPEVARACLAALVEQLRMLKAHVLKFDRLITAWHRSNETSMRLDALPGVDLHWLLRSSPASAIRRLSDQD